MTIPELPSDFAKRFPIKDTPMMTDLMRHHAAMVNAEERCWFAEFKLAAAKREIAKLEKELAALRK